jgi:hypothetical protein
MNKDVLPADRLAPRSDEDVRPRYEFLHDVLRVWTPTPVSSTTSRTT